MKTKYCLLAAFFLPLPIVAISYATTPAIIIARHTEKNASDNNKMTPAGIWHSEHLNEILQALYAKANIKPLGASTDSSTPPNIPKNELYTIYPGQLSGQKADTNNPYNTIALMMGLETSPIGSNKPKDDYHPDKISMFNSQNKAYRQHTEGLLADPINSQIAHGNSVLVTWEHFRVADVLGAFFPNQKFNTDNMNYNDIYVLTPTSSTSNDDQTYSLAHYKVNYYNSTTKKQLCTDGNLNDCGDDYKQINSFTITPSGAPTPAKPGEIKVNNLAAVASTTSAIINWTVDDKTSTDPKHIHPQSTLSVPGTSFKKTCTTDSCTETVTGLKPQTGYTATVTANDNGKTGSSSSSFQTPDSAPQSVTIVSPQVQLSQTTSKTVAVTWTVIDSVSDGSMPNIQSRISINKNNAANTRFSQVKVNATCTQSKASGDQNQYYYSCQSPAQAVDLGTTYNYTIKASDSGDNEKDEYDGNFATRKPAISIENISNQLEPTTATFNWTIDDEFYANDKAPTYQFLLDGKPQPNVSCDQAVSQATTWNCHVTITGLLPDSTHGYIIKATDPSTQKSTSTKPNTFTTKDGAGDPVITATNINKTISSPSQCFVTLEQTIASAPDGAYAYLAPEGDLTSVTNFSPANQTGGKTINWKLQFTVNDPKDHSVQLKVQYKKNDKTPERDFLSKPITINCKN